MHARGRGDNEVKRSAARFSAAADEGCGETTPLARDSGIDRQRIEGCFDNTEALRAASSLVLRVRDKDSEVQLRERRRADGAFEIAWRLGSDQDRSVKDDPHSRVRERVGDLGRKPPQIVVERLWRGRLPDSPERFAAHPPAWAGWSEPGDRASRDRDREFFASLCPS